MSVPAEPLASEHTNITQLAVIDSSFASNVNASASETIRPKKSQASAHRNTNPYPTVTRSVSPPSSRFHSTSSKVRRQSSPFSVLELLTRDFDAGSVLREVALAGYRVPLLEQLDAAIASSKHERENSGVVANRYSVKPQSIRSKRRMIRLDSGDEEDTFRSKHRPIILNLDEIEMDREKDREKRTYVPSQPVQKKQRTNPSAKAPVPAFSNNSAAEGIKSSESITSPDAAVGMSTDALIHEDDEDHEMVPSFSSHTSESVERKVIDNPPIRPHSATSAHPSHSATPSTHSSLSNSSTPNAFAAVHSSQSRSASPAVVHASEMSIRLKRKALPTASNVSGEINETDNSDEKSSFQLQHESSIFDVPKSVPRSAASSEAEGRSPILFALGAPSNKSATSSDPSSQPPSDAVPTQFWTSGAVSLEGLSARRARFLHTAVNASNILPNTEGRRAQKPNYDRLNH